MKNKTCKEMFFRFNQIILWAMLLLPAFSGAQGVVNNGAAIIINGTNSTTSNTYVNINGNYLNQAGGLISCRSIGYDANADGSGTSSITVGGNWTNNASAAAISGTGLTVIFNGATAQTIGGTTSSGFFNLICSGSDKTFSAPSSAPYALQTVQNYSVNCNVTYSNISSILVGKMFMGSNTINSGSLPVTVGDDYLNTASGYAVTGDWTYTGTGGGSLLMVGGLNYKNLIITSGDGGNKTAPLNGTTTISGTLTVNDKCTFQAQNRFLTLLSTATGTANIAPLTGTASITGNVNVQRFMPGNYGRSYRLISSPVNTSTGFYTVASILNNTPITGPNPVATITTTPGSSFDPSNTNNSSIWMYREGDPFPANTVIKDSDYKGVYSLTENIPVGTGLLFFNRGNRTTNLTAKLRGPTFPTPEDNAIVFTGLPNQGSISVNVPQNNINNFTVSSPYAKESPGSSLQSAYYYRYNSSYAPVANLQRTNWFVTSNKTGDQATDGFNLIGNPYASTIDLDQVTFGTDISPLVYMYNPINKQFSYYSKGSATNGSVITDGNGANRYVASGQGFFARNTVVGSTNAGIIFNETSKVNTALTATTSPVLLMSAKLKGGLDTNPLIMGAPVGNLDPNIGTTSSLMVQLKTDSINYDGIGLYFNKNWVANYDQNDAGDLDGISPTVYLSSYSADNLRLAINKMPSVYKQMRIKLYVDASTTANQQLRITDMANIAPKYNVYVIDHYKKDSLQLNTSNAYNFNINRADTSSNGANRLELVFKLSEAGAYQLLNFSGKISGRSVVLNWTTKNEAGYTSFTVEKSVDGGKTFQAITTIPSNSSGTYSTTDNQVENGNPVYRIKQNVLEETSYSGNVEIKFNALNITSFYVYPNPASSYILINTAQNLKGKSEIRITNMAGVMALKSTVTGSNSLRMDISQMMPGVYIAELLDADLKVIGRAKFIKN